MIITRDTDYALRILRALMDGQLHTVGELARGELLPQPFAYKIIKKLCKAGLVQITRGAAGGCRLSADLSQVTLYDLLLALGEPSAIAACMEPGYACPWRERQGDCVSHRQLAAIQRTLDRELQSHTLREILTGQPA